MLFTLNEAYITELAHDNHVHFVTFFNMMLFSAQQLP